MTKRRKLRNPRRGTRDRRRLRRAGLRTRGGRQRIQASTSSSMISLMLKMMRILKRREVRSTMRRSRRYMRGTTEISSARGELTYMRT